MIIAKIRSGEAMEPDVYCRMREVEDRHWWFVARRCIVKEVVSSVHLPPKSRILDVGTGTGGNLEFLSGFGDVIGIESDDMAVFFAKARNVATVLKVSLLDELPFAHGEFDLVILLDVLEHIDDDGAALECLKRVLSPDGIIVITVPAFSSLWSVHDVRHHHKRRYRYSQLHKLLRDNGFRIHTLTYFNTWLFPIFCVFRLVSRLFPYKLTCEGLSTPNSVLNRLLTAIFSSERYLVVRSKLPFGSSLLAVAQNNAT